MPDVNQSLRQRDLMLSVLRRIPPGKVASYGQVAALAGFPRHARQVGRLLNSLPAEMRVPWHRVVNARGKISARSGTSDCADIQRDLLEAEGIEFLPDARIDLHLYGWDGK